MSQTPNLVLQRPAQDFDTWVIRAVYEQLQNHLKCEYPSFPLRPTDRLKEDLRLDADDLDDDLADEVSERTGRSLADTGQNPYYDKVNTVADMVAFFCAQARPVGEQPDVAAKPAPARNHWL